MNKILAYVDEKKVRLAKVVAQSNHDGGCVPEELKDYADRPLYLLIALWCYRQRTWIDRKQISAAFAITERRASFQISYIIRKNNIVRCQTRKIKAPGSRHLCHEILVENVLLTPEDVKKPSQSHTNCKRRSRDNICQNDMRWLLSRSISSKS
ncbi:CaiF/GrlA family transcriptional regulator [Erwinia sorbitola]|uniref:CaiF/GrlA family transcriptional regulator n=1 Tax=Erwinia sorbitola TaxID=2681984 RepID=A0A6I6EUP1_9GAMM|nr:CaiF/GrlA family transcriptional regulator [Erwinia sorbitola]MTD28076.1 CaiF/GrlA family transcriptional regulator [Erwinia sorbitola]QGU85770.1 CaiF/GrlA family transcriptional regulator [Erwinia sorbitola]